MEEFLYMSNLRCVICGHCYLNKDYNIFLPHYPLVNDGRALVLQERILEWNLLKGHPNDP